MEQQDDGIPGWAAIWPLLEAAGASGPAESVRTRLETHVRLIQEWNARAGLVANAEPGHLWARHVLDSLSLMPYLPGGGLLDIGSGGGFPGLTLASVLPDRPITLLERNGRKVSFLRRATTLMGLRNVTLVPGAFPEVPVAAAAAVTARAVERPEGLAKRIASWMPDEAVYLCQNALDDDVLAQWFHVEHVDDAWSQQGWRRGRLRLLRPRR